MGVVIRQSFWGTVITFVGVAIGYLNSLILFPYFLDVEEYGLFRLIQSNGMILIPLAIIGMNGAYVKFFPEFKKERTLVQQFFSFQLVVVIIGAIFFSCLILLLDGQIKSFYEEKSSLFNDYLYVTIIIFVSQSLFNYLISFLWSHYNIVFPNFLNEIFLRLVSTAIVALYGFKIFSFPVMIFWIGMSYILTTLILYLYIFIKHEASFDWEFYKIEVYWVKRFFRFGLYTMLITTCGSVILNISYPLTSSYLGLDANAILTISIYIGTIIELPKRSISQVISPIITQHFTDQNAEEIKKAFIMSSINLGLLSLLLNILIITNLDSMFQIIPKGEIYATGIEVIIIVCIAKSISMIGGISSEIINFSNFYKINILITVLGALLMVGLNLLFIRKYGILGSGLSILITTVVNQVIRYWVIFAKLKIRPFEKEHFVMIIIAVIVYFITTYIPKTLNPYLDIIVRATFVVVFFLGITYVMKISMHFNQFIDKLRVDYSKFRK